jgi:hypothetical protein
MIDTSKGYYLELEQRLYSLRAHFDICQGASNAETADWARFFLVWSQKASKYCDSWSLENLGAAEGFVRNLEKSKIGIMGYEVLERIMAEASWNLNQEILKNLKGLEMKKPVSRPADKKSLVSVVDSLGLSEDTDSPGNSRLHLS